MVAYTKNKIGNTTSMLPFVASCSAQSSCDKRGEQTWDAANDAGGCTATWCDDCEQCGDSGGLRACCGYCNLVFHPTCLDPQQNAQVVENWDEVAFACGRCVTGSCIE